jgi:hypothetical protein
MSTLGRFFCGALGGLLPVLVALHTLDMPTLKAVIAHDNDATWIAIGYSIQVIGLVSVGGILAAMNTDIGKPLPLLQIGVAAPAIISSYATAASVANKDTAAAPLSTLSEYFIGAANARERTEKPQLVFVGSKFDAFINGLTPGIGARAKETIEDVRRPETDGRAHVINRYNNNCFDIPPNTIAASDYDKVYPTNTFKVRSGTCAEHSDD